MYSTTCLTLDNGSDCDLVERVFRTMHERNVVAWNTMFSWYVKRKRFSEAVRCFVMMMRLGIKPIVVSFTNVFLPDQYNIITYTETYKVIFLWIEEIPVSEIGDFRVADVLYGLLVKLEAEDVGTTDDVTFVFALMATSQLQMQGYTGMESNLIDMYAKSNMIREEQAIFQWNAMIAGNTQNGLIEQSFVVYKEMLEQNVKPNDVTLASILPSCSQSGSIAIGKQLHYFAIHNLFENNCFLKYPEKNSVTYTNMSLGYGLHGMGRKAITLFYSLRSPVYLQLTGLVDSGLQIFELMGEEYGIQPSVEHYACVVDMLGRVGRLDEAHNFAKKLGVEEEGNWQSVDNVRRGMRKMGLSKVVGCSWIDTSRYPHCFVSKDKKHPQYCMIYDMLGYLTINMKDAGYPKLELT
ncbi:hypothetical protein KY289_008256 [Solanum tuberosum]|nr:hypothetical protein KY289_008256 [Solanum tuberosum]